MTDFSRRSTLAGLLALAAAGGESREARAAGWPDRPITLIVPFPAGGGSDLFARPIAARMAAELGQTIVVDNRGGAGGTIGTAVAARAAPDGYTLLLGDTGLIYAPTIYPKPGFDFLRDFTPVGALARVPYVLAVNPARLDVATLAATDVAAAERCLDHAKDLCERRTNVPPWVLDTIEAAQGRIDAADPSEPR